MRQKTQCPLCQQCVPSMRKGREHLSANLSAGTGGFYAPSNSVAHCAHRLVTLLTRGARVLLQTRPCRASCVAFTAKHIPDRISCATVNPGLSLLQQRGSDHTAAAAAAVSRMETTRGICDPMSAASFLRLSFGAQKLSSNVELLLVEIFPSSMRLLELK